MADYNRLIDDIHHFLALLYESQQELDRYLEAYEKASDNLWG